MYYLGELARKPCTRQEVLGSNPAGCKKFFSVWDILSRFCHPGQKPPAFCPGRRIPVPKSGQKAVFVVVFLGDDFNRFWSVDQHLSKIWIACNVPESKEHLLQDFLVRNPTVQKVDLLQQYVYGSSSD